MDVDAEELGSNQSAPESLRISHDDELPVCVDDACFCSGSNNSSIFSLVLLGTTMILLGACQPLSPWAMTR